MATQRTTGKKLALSLSQILAWADAHRQRTGKWPQQRTGAIDGAAETWGAVDLALRHGLRGLAGGSSLPQALARHRSVRNRANRRPLTNALIVTWAESHRRRTGEWPQKRSGRVVDAPHES